jgi:hypothetical protein
MWIRIWIRNTARNIYSFHQKPNPSRETVPLSRGKNEKIILDQKMSLLNPPNIIPRSRTLFDGSIILFYAKAARMQS